MNKINRQQTKSLTLIYFMYLIDHVAELRFVKRFIYAIKRIYIHTHTHTAGLHGDSGEQVSCGTWWLTDRFDAFRPKGRGFESRSSRHVGTLGKSFTRI